MGAYVYRIEPKAIGELGGRPVYPAVYAYKPFWNDNRANTRMAFQSGVARCRAAWRKQPAEAKAEILVALGSAERGYDVYRHRGCSGSLVDDTPNGFDQAPVAQGWQP